MKAAIYTQFKQPLTIENVADPSPSNDGVVVKVGATGLCRSDWHGWMGHDPDICLPHVPGHELAGTIEAVGENVSGWRVGDRVTLPFVCGCGSCGECASGNQQVCDNQFQPGFSAWGSYAEYVAIDYAQNNLVKLPDELSFETAASLGCRFVTSFRAIVDQGQVQAGEWVVVHGCGGVGLSAIMIASSLGANVIAVDICDQKLAFAKSIGAVIGINAQADTDVVARVLDITQGGAHLSIDALGSTQTCFNSIANLRTRGRHVQVGLMAAADQQPVIPMDKVIAKELQIMGSHGMQAHRYPQLLAMIKSGKLQPQKLIGSTISLEQSLLQLTHMNSFSGTGVTVINRFN